MFRPAEKFPKGRTAAACNKECTRISAHDCSIHMHPCCTGKLREVNFPSSSELSFCVSSRAKSHAAVFALLACSESAWLPVLMLLLLLLLLLLMRLRACQLTILCSALTESQLALARTRRSAAAATDMPPRKRRKTTKAASSKNALAAADASISAVPAAVVSPAHAASPSMAAIAWPPAASPPPAAAPLSAAAVKDADQPMQDAPQADKE